VAEFREGIRELNYDVIGESEVWPGLEIEINQSMGVISEVLHLYKTTYGTNTKHTN
jgi:hypothetical protein